MAVRTRKSTSTLPSEPVTEPAAAAPTRRRVPGTRAAATRRPATSSRTLRPIVPPEPSPEPEAEALIAEVTPVAEAAPLPADWAAPEPTPAVAPEAPVATPASSPPDLLAEALAVAPSVPIPTPELLAEALEVALAVEISTPEPLFIPAPGVPTAEPVVAPAVALSAAETPAAEPSVALLAEAPASAAPPPASGLPLMVEQLQTDVRVLQSLVTGHTEQTVHELGRTTMQMVRMVTGVAHHLDQLAEQVQQLSTVAQTLAQALTRVEGTVATLQARTQDQILLATRGQRELQDVLAPVLSELVALRAQSARNLSMDRLDQFRLEVELKQLRQSVEKHGPPPELVSALPRPSRARPKR